METKKLDCTGLECPMPVIKTKNFLEENDEISLEVTVDNAIAKENVSKLAKSMNLEYSVKEENGKFILNIIKNSSDNKAVDNLKNKEQGQTILIKTQYLGTGDDELGAILMKSFVFSLTQSKPYPKKIIFLNSGVKLTTTNEETIKNLKLLEDEGTQIISCGTCLDFYNVKESLKVGSVGNMYDIVDSLNQTTNKLII